MDWMCDRNGMQHNYHMEAKSMRRAGNNAAGLVGRVHVLSHWFHLRKPKHEFTIVYLTMLLAVFVQARSLAPVRSKTPLTEYRTYYRCHRAELDIYLVCVCACVHVPKGITDAYKNAKRISNLCKQ